MPDDEREEFTDDEEEPDVRTYLAPAMQCQHCSAVFELPYSNLPETDWDGRVLLQGEDPPELPKEGWIAVFGCRKCGRVSAYHAHHVHIVPIHKPKAGIYQSGKGVVFAEFPCGDKHCKVPASMYVDIGDRTASDLLSMIREGRFPKAYPCGHEIKTVPARYYQLTPVVRRLW